MIHLLFTILLLPLTLPFLLLRMLFGVLGISTRILFIPLKIFARHTVLCLFLIGAAILYFAIKSDPHSIDTLKPAALTQGQQAKTPKGNVPPVIEPVSKYENGDSSFATDSYAMMTEPERARYSHVFYTAMRTLPDDKEHIWNYYNIHGSLKPTGTFKNKQGVICRSFTEVLKVHQIQQTISGTACDKGDGSWCKLKPNATPACGLGHEAGAFDGITNAVKNLF